MKMSKRVLFVMSLMLVSALTSVAANQPTTFDQVIDRFAAQENKFLDNMEKFTPMVETYIQDLKPDAELGAVPASDHYFLSRLTLSDKVDATPFDAPDQQSKGFLHKFFAKSKLNKLSFGSFYDVKYLPAGFAQMVTIDPRGLDKQNYEFKFVRREFVGDLRTIVVDVTPKPKSGEGRFLGRIWVEDQDFNIVRYNGTYVPHPSKGVYLHFDGWRTAMGQGAWLPAYIYSEEQGNSKAAGAHIAAFKAQTRFWGYEKSDSSNQGEWSQILVEDSVKDQSVAAQDLSPLESTRAWERQAEDNVLERLERAGLLAKSGEVDKVLQTVVNNIEITNELNIQPEIRCRVLLTAPLESFTAGHTIVVSRGLLDVLPDEASLAAVLAHELSHVVLGHRLDTKFAFSDRLLFRDEGTFSAVKLDRTPEEEAAADKKAFELLQKSPYKDKLANAGLFLRALQKSSPALPHLLRAQMGNQLVGGEAMRMSELTASAPELDANKLDQISALPLGGRIKLDPWSNNVEIAKNKGAAPASAREKMPFEVTPIFPHLTRPSNAVAPEQTSKVAAPGTGE